MSARLVLVRHAATEATRRAVLGGDGPLAGAALQRASALGRALPRPRRAWTSPALCARDTAAAANLDAEVEPALADWDLGSWNGRALDDLEVGDPEGAIAWRTDPGAAPHGGESLTALIARVAAWLDAWPADARGMHVAVTHSPVICAAVVHVLGAPAGCLWRMDVAPLGVTELKRSTSGWRLGHLNWEPALLHVPRTNRRAINAGSPA